MTALAAPPPMLPKTFAPADPADGAVVPPWVRRFTGDEYDRMVKVGVLAEDERVELLDGLVVRTMSRDDDLHDDPLERLIELLTDALRTGWRVRGQMAIAVANSRPEPDIAIVRRVPGDRPRPTADNTAAVIEVSNATLGRDRGWKQRIYGGAGIPTYWIVNTAARQIEVHSEPTGPAVEPGYARREVFAAGAVVPLVLDGEIAVLVPVDAVIEPAE